MHHVQNLGNQHSLPPQQRIGYLLVFEAFHIDHGASRQYHSYMIPVSLCLYPSEKQDTESASAPGGKDKRVAYHNYHENISEIEMVL